MEAQLDRELTELHFRGDLPDLAMREQIGQMGFMAALGGFRSLVASMLDIQAYLHLADKEWGKIEAIYTLICRLQPRNESYWDKGAWNCTYNATADFRDDKELRAGVREKLISDYIEKGKSILNEGLIYNPDSGKLHIELGLLYRDKDPNPPRSAEHFLAAYERLGRGHLERSYAHELVKCSERARWERAYEVLKRHYDEGGKSRTPSAIRDLQILEERLWIPPSKRIRPPSNDPLRQGLPQIGIPEVR